MLHHQDRKRVVHKDLVHLTILQPHKQTLPARRSTHRPGDANPGLEPPLALTQPGQGVQQQPISRGQQKVVGDGGER
eukprot:scaffold10422_cov73-Isochrysis_galbana.AAC.2